LTYYVSQNPFAFGISQGIELNYRGETAQSLLHFPKQNSARFSSTLDFT